MIFRKKPDYLTEARKFKSLIKKLYSLRLVRVISISLLVIFLSPLILFLFLKPTPVKDINYGVTFSKKYAEQLGLDWKSAYLKILDDLKVKNLRLVLYWEDTERQRNIYDYSDIKWQLDEALKRDVKVMLSVGYKVPRYPECFPPSWWKGLTNENERNNELYEYIATTVKELRGYSNIYIWQVENEPFWPFGECIKTNKSVVESEIKILKSLDDRSVLVQDSGEGGFWAPTYNLGDYLGISMYRKIWYDFWGVFMGNFTYFQYPLAHWSYKIKANLVGVPMDKIMITELQAEPWGPGINSSLTREEKNKTMSRNDFIDTLNYAQKSGFKDLYLWGVEWWLWEKETQGESFYWDTAKALFQ